MTQNDKMAACAVREDGTQMDTVKKGRETYGKKIGRQSLTKKKDRE